MTTVSRETSFVFSLKELLVNFGEALEASFVWPVSGVPGFSNVHSSLLPYLLLYLSSIKSMRCIVSVEGFQVRQKLFEGLSEIVPGSVFNLSHGSSLKEFSGVDLHIINSFSAGLGSFLLVEPELVGRLAPLISLGKVEPLKFSSISTRSGFLSLLNEWGFDMVRRVDSPGTYSVRGGVIDFFCFGALEPLRFEYDGDKLVSARSFDLFTQKMVGVIDLEKVEVLPPLNILSDIDQLKSEDSSFIRVFLLEPTGSSCLYNLLPVFFCDEVFNLACVSHPSFIDNKIVLKQLLSRFSKRASFKVVLFCGEAHNHVVGRDSLLSSYSICNLPLGGAFSSKVLGFFGVSLYSIYKIEKEPVLSSSSFVVEDFSKKLDLFPWKGPVVHEDLGIGLYLGLSRVSKEGVLRECIALEFKHGDLVHVPLDSLDLITNYVSNIDGVVLSDLRSNRWVKRKNDVLKSAGEMLDRFVELYGERDRVEGYSFSPDELTIGRLTESFPYSETKDQIRCIEEVRVDMESKKPMDRLICGDVGVGKTEVALRATYKAVSDGKQVLLLAPTTILASQLFNGFSSRLAPLGVNVKHFSRLTLSVEAGKTLVGLSAGKVDVVIGTLRLLSKNVSLPNLGLVIIDEEHRFGAKQKELLRGFRSSVDVLSMSATPIPRTLQFSLVGIRDISTIRNPPPGRLPVITSVEELDFNFIRSAILYETGRGGQVFFVHSNISEIGRLKKRLQLILPELSVGLAHGRLNAEQLENVMFQMVDGELDLLLSTTIIEAGIDLPNVNTIFINNAHRYGLAQLYQMRGRVGRSSVQAYCYLVLPKIDVGGNARERLRTIQYNTELGSGFDVAMRDLEMRGGGNLFGVEQSGHMAVVGFHLYTKIIQEAALKKLGGLEGNVSVPEKKVSISVGGDALIPEDYIQEQNDRLYFYQLLASAESPEKVIEIENEMCDRFGPPPKETVNLLAIKRVRISSLGFPLESIEVSAEGSTIWILENKDIIESIGTLLGPISTSGIPYFVINDSSGKSGLFLPISSITNSLLTIQYTFESSSSSL